MSKCSSQDFANLCWGLVRLRVPLGPGFKAAAAAQLVARADSVEAPHLAVLLWALGKMEHRLSKRDLRTLEDATFLRMPQMAVKELATTVWGFAAMGQAPSVDWLSDFTLQLRRHSGRISDQDWALVLRSLSAFRSSELGPEIEDLLVTELEPRLGRLSPATVATVIYSCGVLGSASPSILTRSLALVKANMSRHTPSELSSVLWACAQLEHQPGAPFMAAFEAGAARGGAPDASHAACYAWAMARLRIQPSAAWLESFMCALPPLLPRMTPKEVATTTWALAAWRAVLPSDVLAHLSTTAKAVELRWDAQTQGQMRKAMARLRIHTLKATSPDALLYTLPEGGMEETEMMLAL
ncbi:MAG: hypothetical protein WDW36_003455 [Sanguina aurantia]